MFPRHKEQDDGSEEGYVNEDLGPPAKGKSVIKEGKSSDESDEEGYVNDGMGPPEKVHSSILKMHGTQLCKAIMILVIFFNLQIKDASILENEASMEDVEATDKMGKMVGDGDDDVKKSSKLNQYILMNISVCVISAYMSLVFPKSVCKLEVMC